MTLNLGGKELKLTFGMLLAERVMTDAFKRYVTEGGKRPYSTYEWNALVIYHAHENHCVAYDGDLLMTKGEIYRFIEDNRQNEDLLKKLNEVNQAYKESTASEEIERVTKVAQDAIKKQPVKKKKPAGVK